MCEERVRACQLSTTHKAAAGPAVTEAGHLLDRQAGNTCCSIGRLGRQQGERWVSVVVCVCGGGGGDHVDDGSVSNGNLMGVHWLRSHKLLVTNLQGENSCPGQQKGTAG